jgi:preprotein translocase subunit SecE
MNRQAKRMMAKQKATAQDRTEAARERRSVTQAPRKRTSLREFLKEVRLELRKVNWPTRHEVVAYTIVVLVTVVVLTSFVFALDLGFSKAVLKIFGQG